MTQFSKYTFGPQPTQAPDPKDVKSPVQRILLRLLFDHGLSQGEIQRQTQIPQTRVSRYARGFVPKGADDVFKLIDLEQRLEKERKAEARKATTAPAG